MVTRVNFIFLLFASLFLYCVTLGDASKKLRSKDIGVIVPLFTPFKNNSCELNIDNICEVTHFNKAGVDGYLLLSKTGEGPLLSEKECKIIIEICVKKIRAINETAKIFVQVGPPSQSAMALARFAEKYSVSGIYTLIPLYYNRQMLSTELVVKGIKMIADCAPNTPIFFAADPLAAIGLYLRYYEIFKLAVEKVPTFGGMSISEEEGKQIRASGIYDPEKHALIIRNHYSISGAAYFGFNGHEALATNLAPELSVGIWHAKNYETAIEYQEKLDKLIASISSPTLYLSATKATYSMITGIYQGDVRPPIPRISCEQKKTISEKLQALGYKLKQPVTSCKDEVDGDYQCVCCDKVN